MTDSLVRRLLVAAAMERRAAGGLMNLLPAIIFLVGCFLCLRYRDKLGNLWNPDPHCCRCFEKSDPKLMIISIAACMAGAVCGDHCSPISDTTIMVSAGAQCDHVNHVTTQLPYVITVAAVSFCDVPAGWLCTECVDYASHRTGPAHYCAAGNQGMQTNRVTD